MKEQKENVPSSPILFRDLLIKVGYYRPNRAIENSLSEIDLGRFSTWADELSMASLRDFTGMERGRVVYVLSQGKVLVENKILFGQRNGRGQIIHADLETRRDSIGRYTQRIGTLMHSHGALDFPPSPQDVFGLLLASHIPDNQLCTFVCTPTRKILIFRTEQTPSFTLETAQEYIDKWSFGIQEERQSIFSSKPDFQFQQEKQERILNEKAKELHLAFFVAEAEKDIAVRTTSIQSDTSAYR